MTLRQKFIGDRAFYKRLLVILIPIIVQTGITNFVNLLDNIMVGQLGTEPMSGVAIVNQLVMVFNVCIFGAVSGVGLFTAQFYGKGDQAGIRHTVRLKLMVTFVLTVGAVALFLCKGQDLIRLYLAGESDGGDPTIVMEQGWLYLLFVMLGFLPFLIEQSYAGTLRECGETVLPMKAGIAAVFVNIVFNYLLIFGKFGFPMLGVAGAAIATSLARLVEAVIVVSWVHRHKDRFPFVEGLYKTFRVPFSLAKRVFFTGTPLLLNETLWSAGMAMLMQCYSIRGLNVVAGYNITSALFNVCSVAVIASGTAIAIIVGQLLGANKLQEARDTDNKLIAFAMLCGVFLGLLTAALAPFFPSIYNTTQEAKALATGFLLLQALYYPLIAFTNAAYFTLRSGGKTGVTFLFDSVFVWVISVPLAFVLSHYTDLHVYWVFGLVCAADFIKCIIGGILLKKGVWIHNIVNIEQNI